MAVEALAVLDQLTERAWAQSIGGMGLTTALFLSVRSAALAREMDDTELEHLILLAYVGHTYMCQQKMQGGTP